MGSVQRLREAAHKRDEAPVLFGAEASWLAAKGFSYSSPTAASSAGCTRVNVGGAYVGLFSSMTTCSFL